MTLFSSWTNGCNGHIIIFPKNKKIFLISIIFYVQLAKCTIYNFSVRQNTSASNHNIPNNQTFYDSLHLHFQVLRHPSPCES